MGALPKEPAASSSAARVAAAASSVAGRSFVGAVLGGKYEIVRVIGLGGMGVVCEARHLHLGNRRFAVKLVQRYFAGSEIAEMRFRREVRAISSIESDHIVQITDVGVDPDFGLYMVMEYMQGEDLASYLHRAGPLKAQEAIRIAQAIARGLAKAHAARLLHRDLKPGNVFLVQKEKGAYQVKIFDFGISKLVGDPELTGTWNCELTGVGMPVGTPQYMSPEQAHGAADLDARTDVWALGAVLFEMLAGRPPFQPRGRAHNTILRIMTEPAPRLESVAPWVAPNVARIVNQALERDRNKRIRDCETFAELLEEAIPTEYSSSRRRIHEEVTLMVPVPPPSDADATARATAQAASPNLADRLEPAPPMPAAYTPPSASGAHPTSHVRLTRTPSVRTTARPRSRFLRGVGLFALGLVIAVAIVFSGHAARRFVRGPVSYAAAPAPALR